MGTFDLDTLFKVLLFSMLGYITKIAHMSIFPQCILKLVEKLTMNSHKLNKHIARYLINI